MAFSLFLSVKAKRQKQLVSFSGLNRQEEKLSFINTLQHFS